MTASGCLTLVVESKAATVSNDAKIAERLVAHARLCRQLAEQSWSENAAKTMHRLAEECLDAVATLDAASAVVKNSRRPS